MLELLTSRSRALDGLRCPRARWWLHEAQGHGFSPVKVAIPLATGSAVHAGLAALLRGSQLSPDKVIEAAVHVAVFAYEASCAERGLELDALESQSFVFNEQKALVEALVRLAGLRVVPRLLEMYEVLEVERLDTRTLYEDPAIATQSGGKWNLGGEFKITWRSIPDALLRSRTDGGLYLLSWKTCSQLPYDDDARVDMQGVSEAWAIQGRLGTWAQDMMDGKDGPPSWFWPEYPRGSPPKIRGVQMVYLVKGQRRDAGKDAAQEQGLTLDQIRAGARTRKTASPLIYGYKDQSTPVNLATGVYWQCTAPHPMRKSQYYPEGQCPGDGRNHKRGGDWSSFPVWEALAGSGGVAQWMAWLDQGQIPGSGPESSVLDAQWALPIANYRTQEQLTGWLAQTRASEVRIARDLLALRTIEQVGPGGMGDLDALENALDVSVLGPQATDNCANWFGRRCGAWDLCWGSPHIADDPVGSGLYQIKTPYQPTVEVSDD